MKQKKSSTETDKQPAPALRKQTSTAKGDASPQATKPAAAKPPVADAPRKAAPAIPPSLLEEDFPTPTYVSGPGEKFALGPTPPVQKLEVEGGELPEFYGTGRLFLAARDPHWLYANWDITHTQQARYNKLSADGHLILRVFVSGAGAEPASEIHVHPESRHWFAHVERAVTTYFAELGYYRQNNKWESIATSGPTLTPPDSMADEQAVEFATIPIGITFETLVALVKDAARENIPLARAVEELRRSGHDQLPAATAKPAAEWTPAQERALAEVITIDEVRRVWIGSLEVTELIRRQFERELSSIGAAQLGLTRESLAHIHGLPTSPGGAVTSVSSPFGGEQRKPGEKGFWFNVNAELIIYGATEPDATVTIGGRQIKLRRDGSFSYRFALPDGKYDLPAVAVSADGTDARAAELKFSRSTEFRGDVGTHPQDPKLKTPTPDNVE